VGRYVRMYGHTYILSDRLSARWAGRDRVARSIYGLSARWAGRDRVARSSYGLSARWAGRDRVARSSLLLVSVLALSVVLYNFVYNLVQLCLQSCTTLSAILCNFV
jgi:hypothetical protein